MQKEINEVGWRPYLKVHAVLIPVIDLRQNTDLAKSPGEKGTHFIKSVTNIRVKTRLGRLITPDARILFLRKHSISSANLLNVVEAP